MTRNKKTSVTLLAVALILLFAGLINGRAVAETTTPENLYTYYVPYFNYDAGHWTGIAVTNCSDSDTDLTLTVYGDDGSELLTETDSIKGFGNLVKPIGDKLKTRGWMKISSPQILAGLCFVGNSGANNVMAGSTFIDRLYTRLLVPLTIHSQTWESTVMVCNPNDQATEIKITYFSETGDKLAGATRTLPGNGRGEWELDELFSNLDSFPGGSLEIAAAQAVAAFVLYEDRAENGASYAGINAIPHCTLVAGRLYEGTLTVLQKDAYSDVAGRSSDLWPPHTTTVFEWELGKKIQLNHGTAPDEVDGSGKPFLVEVKVYRFKGTKEQLEALQAAYSRAVYDDENGEHKFLNLTEGEGALEKSFLEGFKKYIADDANGLVCSGPITKEQLVALLEAGDFQGFGNALAYCNWGSSEWKIAFETVLEDVFSALGEELKAYHVCNNDAWLQVELIKHYITTGEIKIPEKIENGPMMYYKPM